MGRHCVIVQFVDDNNEGVAESGTNLKVKGKLWPTDNAGFPVSCSLVCPYSPLSVHKRLVLIKSMLEDEKVSDEQLVLEEAKRRKIAHGPSGPPQPVGASEPLQQNHQAARLMLQQQVLHNQLAVGLLK